MSKEPSHNKYIANRPVGKDQLKNGPQQRIAASIVSDIRQERTTVKLMGLDGIWGAGKSNVISIIQEMLKDSHHVFIYDAWTHQEDLQRRSFLEELTENLQSSNLIDPEIWNERLKLLLAKKTEKTTRTIPRLSYGVISSLLLIVLAPIFVIIATTIKPAGWKIVTGLLPLLVTTAIWAIAASKNKAYRSLAHLFYLYKEKELETSTEETISEKEPSVNEFRNWMRDLSKALNKQVIVVYDNMDRLPKEKMNNLWSMVHTFFCEHSHPSNHAYDKIWVIVPFDRAHIGEAFDSEEKTDQFISKTFPVVYRVSPVVLTDWLDFFGQKYQEVFGHTQDTEYDFVKNIFDRHQNKITPRAIITFLNELLSLTIAWGNEIPLRYMALFVVNKRDLLANPVGTILSGKYLNRVTALFPRDAQVHDYIAALVFNVPVTQASQVALYREILIAIREQDLDKLLQFSDHPGFYAVLEEVYLQEGVEPDSWAVVMDMLEDSGSKNADHQSLFTRIWDQVSAKRQGVPVPVISLSGTDKILIRRLPLTLLRPFIAFLVDQLYNAQDFSGSFYFNSLHELEQWIAARNVNIDLVALLQEKVLMPGDFLNYISAAGNDYPRYKVRADNDDLDRHLTQMPGQNAVLTAIDGLKGNYRFPAVLQSVEDRIATEVLDLPGVIPTFNIYKSLSPGKPLAVRLAADRVRQLLSSSEKDTPEFYELVAMLLAYGEPASSIATAPIFRLHDHQIVNKVASRVTWYTTYGNLLDIAVVSDSPLVQEVAKHLTLENPADSTMDLMETLPQIQDIAANIDVTPEVLFDIFDKFNDQLKDHLTQDNLEELIPNLKTYDLAFGRDKEISRIIRKAAREYLEGKDNEFWGQAFGNEDSYPLQLLLKALSAGLLTTLPSAALDAYKSGLTIYSHQTEVPEFKGPWAFLYEKANKRSLVPTFKNIRDHFLNAGEITSAQFLFFERPLREHAKLEERAGDVVRRILTPVHANDECYTQIVQSSDFYLSLIAKAGDEAIDFIEELSDRSFGEPTDPQFSEFQRKIAALIQKEDLDDSDAQNAASLP